MSVKTDPRQLWIKNRGMDNKQDLADFFLDYTTCLKKDLEYVIHDETHITSKLIAVWLTMYRAWWSTMLFLCPAVRIIRVIPPASVEACEPLIDKETAFFKDQPHRYYVLEDTSEIDKLISALESGRRMSRRLTPRFHMRLQRLELTDIRSSARFDRTGDFQTQVVTMPEIEKIEKRPPSLKNIMAGVR